MDTSTDQPRTRPPLGVELQAIRVRRQGEAQARARSSQEARAAAHAWSLRGFGGRLKGLGSSLGSLKAYEDGLRKPAEGSPSLLAILRALEPTPDELARVSAAVGWDVAAALGAGE